MKYGRKPISRDVSGISYQLPIPVYRLVSQPKGPRGAKGLAGTTITHHMVLDKWLDLAKKNLKNSGFKKIQAIQQTYQLPQFCPKCGRKEGHPVCDYDNRGYDYSKKEIPIPPIRVWWNHSKPNARHLIGTIKIKKKGPMVFQISKGIAFEKLRWYHFLNLPILIENNIN